MRLIPFWAAWATFALSLPALAADPLRVVILPIVVHSGAADSSYVSRGIADMISSRLEQDPGLRAQRVEETKYATTNLGAALALGRERKADFVLFGAFTQFGDGASLDIHCIPALADESKAEAARRIFIQSGAVGEIIPKLDEIVDRVAIYVHGRSGTTPAAVAASPARGGGVDAATLRDLVERVKALEAHVDRESAPADEAASGS